MKELMKVKDWITQNWRSLLVLCFVAVSCLLIALISTVAWAYYNGVVTPQKPVEKPQEENLKEQWAEGPIMMEGPPNFVNSDSSELNFDELENTNSVNSALMHAGNIPVDEVQQMQANSGSESFNPGILRDFLKTNVPIETEEKLDNMYYDLPSPQAPNPPKQKTTVNPKTKTQSSKSDPNSDNPPMTLYKVTKAVKAGAVCLDGSPPAYYHRPGVGPNERSWIIHFNGGAWCFDINACIERSHSSLGSTEKLPKSPPIIQGINSPNPTVNPDFYDWNLVWVVYCDGASFTGNRDRPIISKTGQTIYMRGKRVLNAIINDLLYNRGFQFAESVILTGSSAGSMAAIFQADYIASKFPSNIPIRVLSDAGFFIDTEPLGGKSLQVAFKKVFDMQNSTAGLNQDCIRDMGEDSWKCFLPEVAARYVKTPMFVLNSGYDIWALIYFLGIDCKFPATGEKIQRKKRDGLAYDQNIASSKDINLQKYKRDVSGFEMRPFFRNYLMKVHGHLKKVLSSVGAEVHSHKKKNFQTIYNQTVTSEKREEIANTSLNHTKPLLLPKIASTLIKSNVSNIEPSIVVITTNSSTVRNSTTFSNGTEKQLHSRKTKIEKPLKHTKTSFSENLKSISSLMPTTLEKIQKISDQRQSSLIHNIEVGIKKSNTPKPSQKHNITTTKTQKYTIIPDKHLGNGTRKPTKRHILKQRRSASIAREYINILRSDPPECTGGEMTKALQYHDAIAKATSNSLSSDSARFIVSCIDHSMSLFDETWSGIKIGEKSIQQAFGDWFFERVPREKSNMLDCKYPCNLSCP